MFLCFQGQGTTEHVIEASSASEMKSWLTELQGCISPVRPPDTDFVDDLSPSV